MTKASAGSSNRYTCKCCRWLQRFAENLQIKKAKNDTAHAQYLKDQRKNGKGSLFAFLEVARTLQTAYRCNLVHALMFVAMRHAKVLAHAQIECARV